MKCMRIQLVSDIHLEFDNGVENFSLPKTDADLIVLAGDIGLTSQKYFDWVLKQTEGKQAVMVLGNHEFYGDRIFNVKKRWIEALNGTHVTLLDNDYIDVGAFRILGGTLWTNFQLHGLENLENITSYVNTRLNDYSSIRVDENIKWLRRITQVPYFTPKKSYQYFEETYRFLKKSLFDMEKTSNDKRSIIVSHHAPSSKSLNHFRHDERLKNAYASNLEPFIRRFKPALWIHGHHHESVDYLVDQTRVISNPRGYAPQRLNSLFDPRLVIEV